MTNTFETNAQQCDVTTNSFHVEKPCNGSNASITLSNEAPTQFEFGLQDISGFQMLDNGALMISFVDGDETLVIENYAAMADGGQFQEISLSDGETINLGKLAEGLSSSATAQVADNTLADELAAIQPAAGDDLATLITKSNEYELNAGETYQTDFNQSDVVNAQVNENGDLVISFADETQTTITNFKDIESAEDIPTMTLADGMVINVTDLLTTATIVEMAVVEEVAVAQPKPQAPVENNVEQEIAQARPEDLAAIEPAAGDTAPSGALGNTGANFGSSVSDIGLGAVNAVGPIGVTSLQFDRPEFEDDDFIVQASEDSPVPPVVDVTSVSGYEDNAIDFGVSASPSDSAECLEIIVSGIPAGWTPVVTDVTTAAGVYDAGAGTWTISLLPGESLSSGPVFTPPLNSDADISPLTVTVNQKDPANGNVITGTTSSQFDVIVDAVADPVNLTATNATSAEDTPAPLNIATSLTDVDGSEEITEVAICNVPAGFTLNAGTEVSPGNWIVAQADLATLELTPPANYSGTVSLEVKVTNEEVNFSDSEFDFTNNENITTLPFDVTFTPVADAPILVVEDARVKEDGNIDLPIRAELTDPSETLTIRVQNLDNTWGVSIGTNNGVYNAVTGTWEITLPAGQNYDGAINLTPPADSDGDMPNVLVQAISTESDGTIAQVSETVNVVTDAVADTPDLNAGVDQTTTAGQSVALNITNAPTDTDGSESLGNVTVSGVPTGHTLSAGTQVSPGVWEVAQADLSGLQMNIPANAPEGSFDLTVSVTSTETPTDTEYDFTDNEATNTDTVRITVNPDRDPPEVTFGANGSGQGEVYEDGSVFVPIAGSLSGVSPQILTVTVSGIDPTWTIATGANNGVYNAGTGTWTITMPEGQDYNGGLTFTPPADSDVDLTGLTVTATSTLVSDNSTTQTIAAGAVIVDAVADTPDVNAGADQTVTAGKAVSLNFTNALTDTDGSESLGVVTVSGVPVGYSLTAGTQVSPGVWEVAQADLAGLQLNTPSTASGDVTLTVSVTSTESVTDADFDLTNNTATNTDTIVISVNPDKQPPEVTFGANGSGQGEVYEDGSVFVPISGALNGDAAQVLTVEVSGIPSTWTINNTDGTYNAGTGTWTITLPEGQDYNGGLTFTPPADSDVDLTGLTVTATSTLVSDNSTTQTIAAGAVIVDAVADTPNVNAGVDQTVTAGNAVALNFTNELTDTDGSESLGVVTVSGVPVGYSLSSGTQVSPGVWEVAQADLAGLQLNTPANASAAAITLTVSVTSTESVTDTDFDLTNNTATNTDTVIINVNPDDKPIVTGAHEDVDETNLSGGNVTETGSVSANFGADGPGRFEVNGDFQSSGDRDNGALTHNGVPVVVTNVGDTYYGRAGAVDVFTLQVNSNGSYEFNLIENLDHSRPDQANEEITLTFGFDAVDTDNDKTGGTITVDVKDDVPSITTRFKAINEDGLTSSNVITLTDTLLHSYGQDGPGSINPTGNFVAKHEMGGSNATLTADGVEIVVTSTANGYVGIAGGETIFDLVVNDNGQYTYRQFKAIDHQDTTSANEVIWLKFEVAIVDFDGDTSVGYIGIDVQDSGPVANNDVVTMWSCDWATIGNVVTGYNQDNNGADRLSADGANELKSITSNGQTHEFKDGGNVMVVNLTYGTLIMFKDGAYSYISNQASPKAYQTENLSYTIQDADGDTSTANLSILVKEAKVTDNDASDYGNQTQGTNTVIDGEAAYQTNEVEGAQIFGWNDNDVLSGNVGDDALYGWRGNDKLYGDAGNDILLGEHGNNILEGGEGSDLFGMYGDKANNNNVFDTIVDFDISEGDVLSLTSVISGFGSGDDINDFVRINLDGNTAVVQVNTDGSGNDFYDVAKIQSHNGLDATTLNVQDLFDKGHIDVY